MAFETDTPGNRTLAVIAISSIFCGITAILVALRLIATIMFAHRKITWALVGTTVAFATGIVQEVALNLSVHDGTDRHRQDLDRSQYVNAILWVWMGRTCALISIALSKMAFAIFVFPIIRKVNVIGPFVVTFAAVSSAALDVVTVIFFFMQCRHREYMQVQEMLGTCKPAPFDRILGYVQGGKTSDESNLELVILRDKANNLLGYDGLTDLVLVLFPLTLVARLENGRRRKVMLVGSVLLGVLPAAFCIGKTANLSALEASSDLSWNLTSLAIWESIEMWLVLITTNIPPIWLLFARVINDRQARRSSVGTSSQHVPLHDDPGRRGTRTAKKQDCKHSERIPSALLSRKGPGFPQDGIVQRRDLIVELEIRSAGGDGSESGYTGVAASAFGSHKFPTQV